MSTSIISLDPSFNANYVDIIEFEPFLIGALRKESTLVMAFRQFSFDTPELVLPKVLLQFWQSLFGHLHTTLKL